MIQTVFWFFEGQERRAQVQDNQVKTWIKCLEYIGATDIEVA